jgi:hypothetical protein
VSDREGHHDCGVGGTPQISPSTAVERSTTARQWKSAIDLEHSNGGIDLS